MSTLSPRQLLLSVSFDVDQMGNELVWSVTEAGAVNPDRYRHTGRYAGALQFAQGDVMTVAVLATGDVASFDTFRVSDATLITLPAPYQTPMATPSPFDAQHATFDMDGFAPSVCKNSHKAPTRRSCTAQSTETLTVLQPQGIWKFSLVMTVVVSRPGASGPVDDPARVLVFDPILVIGPQDQL